MAAAKHPAKSRVSFWTSSDAHEHDARVREQVHDGGVQRLRARQARQHDLAAGLGELDQRDFVRHRALHVVGPPLHVEA